MMIRWSLFFLCILTLGCLTGCKAPDLNVFEKNIAIPSQTWDYGFTPSVDFNVSDTNAAYNVYVVCRHTDAYAYKNLWLFLSTRKPGDKAALKDRFELTLQDNAGRWYGTGMDDIWEQRIPLYQDLHFNKTGTYTVTFEQNMRDNPLKCILNIGLRVEKVH
jgi:gliding motility-associated lipoprotein GldH